MKLILTILGCAGILYFVGITCYAGLSSMFPAVWAVAGVFCLGLAACLHLHETAGWFAGFVMPDWGMHVIRGLILAGLVFFICVESFIVRGMYSEPKDNLDYIIVLGAQVKGTRPSRSLRFRLDRAETYLRENPQTIAVLSGGKGSNEEISEADCMYNYLVEKGIEKERLLKEGKSVNTSQNLKFTLKILEENGAPDVYSLGVVTNDFHVFRGVSLGKKLGVEDICGIPAKSDRFLQLNYMVREFCGVVKDKIKGNI